MRKGDKPSLQMVVESGRLVPGGPYEAEVIGTYPNGAVLTVDMHQRRTLPLLKKYWAVLNDVQENCRTPWESKEEASDALKVALGVTDVGKTHTGRWFIRAGSIAFTSMDEAAFRAYYDKSMAILAEVTGIDPDTLSDRYRHIPEQDSSGDTSAARSPDEAAPASSRTVGAATHSAPPPPQASEDGGTSTAVAPPADSPHPATAGGARRKECISKLLAIATDKQLSKEDAAQNLAEAADIWLGELDDKPFVTSVFDTAKKVLRGELTAAQATKFLEGI
jgi:hypothetical protein